ncbi:MAG: hypothetical protein HY353_05540 [Candidatus Omnitrophica bacterium]|nr:hypothetical protein [Candidatus Omnitrophota bacterium]
MTLASEVSLNLNIELPPTVARFLAAVLVRAFWIHLFLAATVGLLG